MAFPRFVYFIFTFRFSISIDYVLELTQTVYWEFDLSFLILVVDEEKKLNATYIISVARKLGCSIFLLPEDIMEVRNIISAICDIFSRLVRLFEFLLCFKGNGPLHESPWCFEMIKCLLLLSLHISEKMQMQTYFT